jgi:hypothetical protein
MIDFLHRASVVRKEDVKGDLKKYRGKEIAQEQPLGSSALRTGFVVHGPNPKLHARLSTF